jgi:hypothetical protein
VQLRDRGARSGERVAHEATASCVPELSLDVASPLHEEGSQPGVTAMKSLETIDLGSLSSVTGGDKYMTSPSANKGAEFGKKVGVFFTGSDKSWLAQKLSNVGRFLGAVPPRSAHEQNMSTTYE